MYKSSNGRGLRASFVRVPYIIISRYVGLVLYMYEPNLYPWYCIVSGLFLKQNFMQEGQYLNFEELQLFII